MIVNNQEKDSENNVNLLFKPRFPLCGRHGKAYLTFGGKNTSGTILNNSTVISLSP